MGVGIITSPLSGQMVSTGEPSFWALRAIKSTTETAAYSPEAAWEVRQIFNIIAKNTLKCDVEIKDWTDLTKPELSGRFAMANPSYSGGAFTTLVGLVGPDGPGWSLYAAPPF